MFKKHNPVSEIKLSGNVGEFEGYASGFNLVDVYKDTVLPGAYAKAIESGRKPHMFVNHDSYAIPIGDWKHLEEDSTGLLVVGQIDLNHKDGPTAHSAIKRGALDAMSIGYNIPDGGSKTREDGVRELISIDLKEISLVNFPADDSARIIGVKADIEQLENLKDYERILRDLGLSKSAATAYVSRLKAKIQRDADNGVNEEITKHDVTDYLVNVINKL